MHEIAGRGTAVLMTATQDTAQRAGISGDGPMAGGTANRGLVWRAGATVRRPLPPCRAATHAVLGHLAAAGFDGAPRVLATDAATETLSYIDGTAAVPPLAEDLLTETALASVADLLRRYHQAVATFDPAGFRWPRPVPARFAGQLVSHNDVHPANVIFRAGRAVALIDFDLAGPGSIAWDLATAARHWSPLYDERDVTDSRQGQALRRFRLLLDVYGLPAAGRREVAGAILANHDWSCAIITDAARAGHAGFIDYWDRAGGILRRGRRWCAAHQRDILAAAG
jgi:aminoglycoside phosphotransferase (APT) family kinase protein